MIQTKRTFPFTFGIQFPPQKSFEGNLILFQNIMQKPERVKFPCIWDV